MKSNSKYRVLLYYKYVEIRDHEIYAKRHLKFCKALDIKGRILISGEGLNGTISGTVDQTDAYINAIHMDPRFEDMEFKIDAAESHVFKKLFVRAKKEIVTFNLDEDLNPNEITGVHLEPEDFLEMMQSEGVVIIDARKDYEYDLGHFKNAIKPEIRTFKQLPAWIKSNKKELMNKKVLTYCTGGVRCEKFSGLLLREGFKNVFQLKGGIINYSKDPETKGKDFLGKCYVFDERISVDVNFADGYLMISKCYHCGKPCDRYVNCAHLSCHFQFICCDECEVSRKRSCSKECEESALHEYKIEKYRDRRAG
jgi:UPF0176 protein